MFYMFDMFDVFYNICFLCFTVVMDPLIKMLVKRSQHISEDAQTTGC